ncbi:MAG: polymerase sigma factor, sigma-70 family [Chthonomonadaceae bacterium]|nr:polymerase sigma factor, sigma-70 family [Chthonomonadaceae bacterium]
MRQPSSSASQEKWEQEGVSLPWSSSDALSSLTHLTRQRLLTFQEESELSARIQQGDARAKDRLVEANMRLVLNIAKNYSNSQLPFEDLVQEGAIGLMMAADRFDPGKGYRFSTYATLWIRQAISRAMVNKARVIRIPAHICELLRKLEGVRTLLMKEQGEEPSAEQIATRLGVSVGQVQALLQVGQQPISLDMLVGEDEDTTLASLLTDHSAADPQETLLIRERRNELAQLLSILSPREREIMLKGLGFEESAVQASQGAGEKQYLSRERAKQIQIQALRKLKTAAMHRQMYA